MIAEFDAVKARLEAHPDLAISESARRNTDGVLVREQYVILFGGPADELDDERLASAQMPDSDATYIYPTRSIAVTADGARRVFNAVLEQLVGFRPVIAGRRCSPIRMVERVPSPVEADMSVTPPLYYVNASFELKSDRA